MCFGEPSVEPITGYPSEEVVQARRPLRISGHNHTCNAGTVLVVHDRDPASRWLTG